MKRLLVLILLVGGCTGHSDLSVPVDAVNWGGVGWQTSTPGVMPGMSMAPPDSPNPSNNDSPSPFCPSGIFGNPNCSPFSF
jgi:hypothetical protein